MALQKEGEKAGLRVFFFVFMIMTSCIWVCGVDVSLGVGSSLVGYCKRKGNRLVSVLYDTCQNYDLWHMVGRGAIL